MDNKVWIALATVSALPGNTDLGNSKAAAVNVLHLANSSDDFKEKVEAQLFEYGFKLEGLEDIEVFDFSKKYEDNLRVRAKAVIETQNLQWGTFYTFD